MKRLLIAVFTLLVGFTLLVDDADARRLGGGVTSGMRRSPSITRPATPPAAPAAAPQAAPMAQPVPPPARSRWLGPLAGLAAGIGLGALLGGGGGGFLSTLLLAALVFFGIRMLLGLFRRSAPAPYAPPSYVPSAPVPAELPPAVGGGATRYAGGSIPADFDVEGFLRQAKLNFVRLQAANDAGNMEDIREVTTPEMYAEIKLQLQERGGRVQNTEVISVNADLLDVTTEASRHIASVRFFGTIREDGPAGPFDEVWHLVKPADGSHGWVIAGIEQVQ